MSLIRRLVGGLINSLINYYKLLIQNFSGNEQESICIRHVKENLEVTEILIGLYEIDDTKATTIVWLNYTLIILCLLIENLRCRSYE